MSLTMNKLAAVIIVSLILIISILAIKLWYNNSKEYVFDEQCKKSVETHAKLIQFGLPAKDSDIHCPAKEITLSKNDNAKRILAEDLRRCWTNFGKGEYDLFEEEEGLLCSVCTIISANDNIEIDDFNQYLAETPMKGSQETYLKYISDFETQDFKKIKNSNLYKKVSRYEEKTIKLSKDEKYANIFIYAKGQDAVNRMLEMLSNYGVGGTSVLVGAGVITLITTGTALQSIPFIGTMLGIVLITGGVTYIALTEHYSELKIEHMSHIQLMPYTENTLKKLGCTHIPVSLIDE